MGLGLFVFLSLRECCFPYFGIEAGDGVSLYC